MCTVWDFCLAALAVCKPQCKADPEPTRLKILMPFVQTQQLLYHPPPPRAHASRLVTYVYVLA
jgi:hypothetical protein